MVGEYCEAAAVEIPRKATLIPCEWDRPTLIGFSSTIARIQEVSSQKERASHYGLPANACNAYFTVTLSRPSTAGITMIVCFALDAFATRLALLDEPDAVIIADAMDVAAKFVP